MKNNDFGALCDDFDAIGTEMEKSVGSAFATDKFTTLPPWVLKNLVALEDCLLGVTAEQKKKLNKVSA